MLKRMALPLLATVFLMGGHWSLVAGSAFAREPGRSAIEIAPVPPLTIPPAPVPASSNPPSQNPEPAGSVGKEPNRVGRPKMAAADLIAQANGSSFGPIVFRSAEQSAMV